MFATFAQDFRIAIRSFWRQPIFTLTVVLTLAIGIGVTSAVFSIVDAAVLRPLPFPHADRIVSIVQADRRFGTVPFAPAYLQDFRERTRQLEDVAGFSSTWTMTLTGAGQPSVVPAAFISDGLFLLFGTQPIAGRMFTDDEYASRDARVVLVSESFWRRYFNAARLDGQMIRLDDTPVTVIGVVPDTLKMPITSSAVTANTSSAEVWLPFAANEYATSRSIPVMNVVARLKSGVSLAQAQAEMGSIAMSLARDYPATSASSDVRLVRLAELVSNSVRRPLTLLLSAVLLLLLIGCSNVANMLLARSTGRSGELAVRSSLGATRGRLVAQLLVESTALSIAGTAVGLGLATVLIRVVPATGFTQLPPSATIAMNTRVVAFSILASGLTILIIGLLPALQMSGTAPFLLLKDNARSLAGRGRRLREALVAGEVALALVLLVGAGLLARSFWTLTTVDPGFSANRVLAGSVSLSATRYGTAERRRAFADAALERLAALNGVEQTALVNRLPFAGGNVLVGVEFEGQMPRDGKPAMMDRRVVSPHYFSAMGIAVLAGRAFGVEDRPESSARAAVVNEALTRRYWPGDDAVGKRLRLMLRGGPGPWLRVVGVVGNVRHYGLDQPPQPEVYVPYSQAPVEAFALLVRAVNPLGLVTEMTAELQRLDPELPVRGIGVMSDAIDASVTEPRMRALLVNAFASFGLLLAALGIYGVVSYSVVRNTKEIGVRIALGAQPADILRTIVGRSMALVGWGAIVGLAASFAITRALRSVLFGVTPTDPVTFGSVTAVLFGVALIAAYVPARRATRLDPVRALHLE